MTEEQLKEYAALFNSLRQEHQNDVFRGKQLSSMLINNLGLSGKGILSELIRVEYLEKATIDEKSVYSFSRKPLHWMRVSELESFIQPRTIVVREMTEEEMIEALKEKGYRILKKRVEYDEL